MFMACAILAMLNILLLDPKSKDEEYLESLIEQEKEESSLKRKLIVEEEQREKDSKKKHREALLDELVGGWLWIVQLMPYVNKLIYIMCLKCSTSMFMMYLKFGEQLDFKRSFLFQMFSERSALDILNEHMTDVDKENELRVPVMATTKFSTGIKLVMSISKLSFFPPCDP